MLAAAGVASRRACEEIIAQGRVSVNGVLVREQGIRVNPYKDEIRLDGGLLPVSEFPENVYIMLNKPVGVHSTVSDPHAPIKVTDLVAQVGVRVFPVGRLDAESSGLILLTNDGEFANKLTHPRYHIPRTYRVHARGFIEKEEAKMLAQGIELSDGKTMPANLTFVDFDKATQCTVLDITIFEGKNRQVRRMMQAIGHPVKQLCRIAFGDLELKGLNPGTWRKLKQYEVDALLKLSEQALRNNQTQRVRTRK